MTNPKDLVGAKKSPLGVVPVALMVGVAPAMQVGAEKYGPFNWRGQKVQAMTYAEAILRHLFAWIDRQDDAEDTGINHIAHAGASIAILLDAMAGDNLLDNRPVKGPAADMLRAQDKSSTPQGEMAEFARISRTALEGLIEQVPGVSMDWNNGDPTFSRQTNALELLSRRTNALERAYGDCIIPNCEIHSSAYHPVIERGDPCPYCGTSAPEHNIACFMFGKTDDSLR